MCHKNSRIGDRIAASKMQVFQKCVHGSFYRVVSGQKFCPQNELEAHINLKTYENCIGNGNLNKQILINFEA